jgi:hypothetical protein
MKLSPETRKILKGFAAINQNLVVKAGSQLTTISARKDMMAVAQVAENFPQDFIIYDLADLVRLKLTKRRNDPNPETPKVDKLTPGIGLSTCQLLEP